MYLARRFGVNLVGYIDTVVVYILDVGEYTHTPESYYLEATEITSLLPPILNERRFESPVYLVGGLRANSVGYPWCAFLCVL